MQLPKADIQAINSQKIDIIYEKALKEKKYQIALRSVDISNRMNGIYQEPTSQDSGDFEISL